MNKIIYTYEQENQGKFGESVALRLEKDGSLTISVYGAPRVDGDYREPGDFASMQLPAGRVEDLVNALWDIDLH